MRSIKSCIVSTIAVLLSILVMPQSQAAMATALSAGDGANCSLTTAGGVQCRGQNTYGQLGNGSLTGSLVPVGVSGLDSGVAVNCPDGVGLCTVASGLLTPGVYGWQVQGFNEYGDGDGEWSALIQFLL